MSLFLDDPVGPAAAKADYALLHQYGCRACPLARVSNKHPDMAASGSEQPLLYFLGEAPGGEEDKQGEPFVGPSGEVLRARIPRRLRGDVRFNNVVRTRPFKNATPDHVSVECCRPSVVADIERTKPRAIIGLGNVPLEWVCGWTGIGAWRGRRMPVRIGRHACWYYPTHHPSYLLRLRRREMGPGEIGSEDERMFVFDMRRAIDEAEAGLPEPDVHDARRAREGTETISGGGSGDLDRLERALAWAARLRVVGIDYETRNLRPYASDSVLLSVAVSDGKRSVAFAYDHPSTGWSARERPRVRELWTRFLREAEGVKVAHNLAFEQEWTGFFFGPELVRAGRWLCTQVQASVLDERSRGCKPGPLTLDFLTQQHFGFSLKDVFALDRDNLDKAPLEVVLQYNAPDAKYAVLLDDKQSRELKRRGLTGPAELRQRYVPTVVLSQLKGVPVSQPVVKKLLGKYEDRVRACEQEIAGLEIVKKFERLRGRYNPMSNADVLFVFRDMLGRDECEIIDKRTKKVGYSTDASVLEQIDHPLARLTLDLREAAKMASTYIRPLLDAPPKPGEEDKCVIYPDGLVHTNFNTTFTDTGRLSSDGPNLQNIPKRSEEGKEIRRAFVSRAGDLIVAADYGQLEARVIAMLSRDKRFCDILWQRYDVHGDWARRIAKQCPRLVGGRKFIEDAAVLKKLREDVKGKWTFALFFGAQHSSVAGYFGVEERELGGLFDDFWAEFGGVKDWQEELQSGYRKVGYVEIATGRRRHGPLSFNQVINTPVQGTGAEIVLDGMARMSETGDPDLQPEINVHDDLTSMRVAKDRVDVVVEKMVTHMLDCRFDFINVPLAVEVSIGKNWMEMVNVGTYSSDEWFGRKRGM